MRDLYDTDEGTRSLPQYIAPCAAITKATGVQSIPFDHPNFLGVKAAVSRGMYGYAPLTKQLNDNATVKEHEMTKQNLPDLRFVIHWLKTRRSVEEAITELEICQKTIDAYKPPTIPEGYVLISEDVLELWGKLQEVKAMARIPCSGEELIKPLERCNK